jgi:hypothetical protein
MKLSAGLTRPWPTAVLFELFFLGALQTLGKRRADLGVAYILVLGLAAVSHRVSNGGCRPEKASEGLGVAPYVLRDYVHRTAVLLED